MYTTYIMQYTLIYACVYIWNRNIYEIGTLEEAERKNTDVPNSTPVKSLPLPMYLNS